MRVPLLTEEEIAAHLVALPEWTRTSGTISWTYKFRNFMQAMAFVNKVADAAEALDHHPDIDIRYSRVTLTLTTHDVRGLTLRDMELATACDAASASSEQEKRV